MSSYGVNPNLPHTHSMSATPLTDTVCHLLKQPQASREDLRGPGGICPSRVGSICRNPGEGGEVLLPLWA